MTRNEPSYGSLGRPCWLDPFGSLDWTPCFRIEVLNGAVPIFMILVSLVFWAMAYAEDKSKQQEQFAREVAQLNPHSSNFYQSFPESSETTPLVYQPTTAAERVFQTENAVVIDVALMIKEDLTSRETKERIEHEHHIKRIYETIGSLLLALSHIVGVLLQMDDEMTWTLYWVYVSALNAYALQTKRGFFAQKTVLSTIYLLVSISNLRTRWLFVSPQSQVVLNICQVVLAVGMAAFSWLSPVSQQTPGKLRALYETMHKRLIYDELRTAVATPPHRRMERDAPKFSGNDEPQPCPEQNASLLSRALFYFVQPAIIKFFSQPIKLSDVPQVLLGDRAASVVSLFRTSESPKAAKRVVLWRRLIRFFLPMFAYQCFCSLLSTILTIVPVLFLSYLLDFFSELAENPEAPLHMGVLFALGMFVSQTLHSVFMSQALMTGRHICAQLRSLLSFEILSKTMRRNMATKMAENETERVDASETTEDDSAPATDGQVVNLVSVDVNRVSEFAAYTHFLLPEQPLSVILSITYLIYLLGSSAAIGFFILVIALPVQAWITRVLVEVQSRMLHATDERMDLANEVLACMKTVKFFAWEKPFGARMEETRSKELSLLRLNFIFSILNHLTFIGTPMLVTLATFGAHTLLFDKTLTAKTAFTALALFNTLRRPLADLPGLIHWLLNALVSVRRIDNYLQQQETEKYEQLIGDSSDEIAFNPPSYTKIGFVHATFTYNSGTFQLKNLDCLFPVGEISCVIGPVGSGKSSLLLAMLGELHRVSGSTRIPCPLARLSLEPDAHGLIESIAYCSQNPWLLGTTVRENILFGTSFDEDRYREVLKACALEPDLDILEFHDETEVGEKGTSLSGGQKARIALARAFYSRAKHILIDDALSAVDAHTARHLVERCFRGPLAKGRTIILVTHAVTLMLPCSAYAVVMDAGTISAQGKPASLLAQGKIKEATAPQANDEKEEWVEDEAMQKENWQKAEERRARKAQADINEEKISREQSSASLYWLYMSAVAKRTGVAITIWLVLAVFYVSIRSADVASGAWLRKWAQSYEQSRSSIHTLLQEDQTWYYMKGYIAIVVVFIVLTTICDLLQYQASLQASAHLYNKLIRALLFAKPIFYDKTPIGRITNRLSRDMEDVDQELSPVIQITIENLISLIAIIAVICWAAPKFLLVLWLVMAMYITIGALYLASSRDLKRIESVQRSPLHTLVGETISGMVTIRAYSDCERVIRQCLVLLDKWNRAFLFLWYENRWLSICCDVSGAGVTLVAALFLLLGGADAALAGFTLSYAITLVDVVLWLVRLYSMVEISMNSVERIGEYIQIPSERLGGREPPAHWPTDSGTIEVKNLSVRYGPEFPLALSNVSFTIKPGEKVGIVGRTGSGKSTLSLAFFRFLEAESGSITIDGIDLGSITLESLRRRLTIIPQDSQLFRGTVRLNLDPVGIYDDADMWFALQRCQLATGTSQNVFIPDTNSVIKSLDEPVEQGGANFSAGQRQLLSLARGLLKMRESRILILDESTANLDNESDALIQQTIRKYMAPGATILTVAHRLKTIIDYDKVLVLSRGNVLEYDSPANLLACEDSSFYQLCTQSGDFDKLKQMANAPK
ncbi:hypothetical protein MYAM1_001345 [Malassezia yamatoensis]|uniref:AAA+ ATPase domain-containing protein n=1 Tax=Malassezia yamatoensis TaxID=253288 RepID=A0AAJ5YSW2_9BASI|nr:hypothetical protein MYAM1_001345 [Malassezia yamatoensis]